MSVADADGVPFPTERALVGSFLLQIRSNGGSPWGPVVAGTEFNYMRGRADIVALTVEGEILAFEAKLTRWRTAAHQAFRNRCFAHRSFVLLPKAAAIAACASSHEFYRRGVGLCFIEGDTIEVLIDPQSEEPVQPWLANRASLFASGGPNQ